MTELEKLCEKAAKAKYKVQRLSEEEKNQALRAVADKLLKEKSIILSENEKDLEAGRKKGCIRDFWIGLHLRKTGSKEWRKDFCR